MSISDAACNVLPVVWSADWSWGLPLIVLTGLLHVSGLGLISQKVVHDKVGHMIEHHYPKSHSWSL